MFSWIVDLTQQPYQNSYSGMRNRYTILIYYVFVAITDLELSTIGGM